MKNKLLLLSAVICLSGLTCANANLALTDLTAPKSPAYRVGISEVPENPYIQPEVASDSLEQAIQKKTAQNNEDLNYADLNIKRLSKEISYDLECDEQQMVSDLSLLWQGAAMQSDTINFALYKLANPEADKPNKSTVKNMLKTLASMSTLVGAGISNPLLAGSSLIGSNVLGIMTQDTKALNYKYSKVGDADMIILIRKVEDLQQNAVNLYYDYMSAKKQLEMTSKLAQDRKDRFELAQKNNAPKEIVVVTDAYFRSALDKQKTARSEFLSKRAALEQFVGNETFHQFEEELAQRESKQKKEFMNEEQNTAYENTVKNVENYTKDLNNMTASTQNVPYAENNEISEDLLAAEKKDKYDTKGLIFLHNKDKETAIKEINAQKALDKIQQETTEVAEETEEITQEVKNKKEKVKKTNKKDKKVKEKKEKKGKKTKNKEKSEKTEQHIIQQPEQIIPLSTHPHENKSFTKVNGVDLIPLDEIRKPDLKPHGYSIFAE